MAEDGKENNESIKDCTKINNNILLTTVAISTQEIIPQFGRANAEFLIGYRGIDNETGQVLSKGLAGIAKYKLNSDPLEASKNIKQQAGFSAEIATTSRDNAESIINGSNQRVVRSDDLPQFGKNHSVVDRVKISNGKIIVGTETQMKFVGDRNKLFERIAKTDGKFARYRGLTLELPSEQFDGAAEYCLGKSQELRKQASHVEQEGKSEVATKLRKEAENYEQLSKKVADSGLTTEKAIYYREHPKIATVIDIARTSHRAGKGGMCAGAIIGGIISLAQNAFAVAQEKKCFETAANDLTRDVVKSSAVGYGTAFTGSALSGVMQQSARGSIRALAKTSVPTLVLSVCITMTSSIKSYVQGDISEAQLLDEVGEKGSGMLGAGMMAALGQLTIPIPFVGAAVGGMIGYTLSSFFYQSARESAIGVERSCQNLGRVTLIETAARVRIAEEHASLNSFIKNEIPKLWGETKQIFSVLDSENDTDAFARAINRYAQLLGKELEFQSQSEFDEFMLSDSVLEL